MYVEVIISIHGLKKYDDIGFVAIIIPMKTILKYRIGQEQPNLPAL